MGLAFEIREHNKWAEGNISRPRYVVDPPQPFTHQAPAPRLETHAEVFARVRAHVAKVTKACADPGRERLHKAWDSWIEHGKKCRGEKWYPCG